MKFQIFRNTIVINASRYILALLFIFSGLAKALNPFGLSIQLTEYFNVLNITFLTPLSSLFAILLPAAETLVGFMLLFGLARRLAAWGVMLFMSFFTLLTLWITITNPVNDCGCFGDLLKISNTATFVKNLLFMVPTLIVFILRKYNLKCESNSLVLWMLSLIASFALPIYSTFNLPLIDATPFKVGVNIPQAMQIPADAQQPIQQTVLHYKNIQSGEIEKFAIDDTTWQNNSNYEFIEAVNETISEGYVPPIASFPMLNRQGIDMSSDLLQSENLLIIATTSLVNIDFAIVNSLQKDITNRVVILTSSSLDSLSDDIEAYNSDFSLIRTIIQFPRGGAILLKHGTIVNKWVMDDLSINFAWNNLQKCN